jgi:hypothetical protein
MRKALFIDDSRDDSWDDSLVLRKRDAKSHPLGLALQE